MAIAVVRTVEEQGDEMIPHEKALINYEDALARLTEGQRLRATVYAMNTLLIAKGRSVRKREEGETGKGQAFHR